MAPFFSIIIPTLNEEQCIGELLEDITRQTFRDFEVIICDGNSIDGTVRTIESYASLLPVRTIQTNRRNLAFQRNLGTEHAHGTYLLIIDADVRLPDTHCFEILHKHATEQPTDVYVLDARFEDRTVWWIHMAEKINNWGVRLSQTLPRPLPSSSFAIFKRSFFQSIGGYRIVHAQDSGKLFVEDQDILYRAKRAGSTNRVILDTHFQFSVRRLQKDGWVRTLTKVLLASIELLFQIPLNRQPYHMGGHWYAKDR